MRLWGHMLDPRHSLHWLLRRSCSHMPDPPHSLQYLSSRLCGHRLIGMMCLLADFVGLCAL